MITLTLGRVQSPSSLVVPNGSVVFQLNMDARVIADPGGQVSSEIDIVFQFDATGNLIQPCLLWSNLELNPRHVDGMATYYLVTFYDANGARINARPMWWIFPKAAGDVVDISQMIAVIVENNVIYYPINIPFPPEPANTVFAGPTSGPDAIPTFRHLVSADLPVIVTTRGIQFQIDGGGSVPTTGSWGQIAIPYNCTIVGWTITSDVSGSAVVDILRSTYGAFPTTVSIAGTDLPTLIAAQKNTDATLVGWGSTTLNLGDELQISLTSVATATRLNVTIVVTVP
jgi:hypothetical protein